MWLVWGKREMHTGFWLVNLKERDHLEELGTYGRIILKQILKKLDGWVDQTQDRGK
jgi:hypothetical protein